MWKFTSSLRGLLLCLAISSTQAQDTPPQINISGSPIITGENAQVFLQQIPDRHLKNLLRISNQLESTLSRATTQKAEAATKSGNNALAADLWGDIANDELLIKKSKHNWLYAIIRKAEAEENFNAGAARTTITKALSVSPNAPLLLEKAAILDLNRYELESALKKLHQLEKISTDKQTTPVTFFLVHSRLSAIYASLGRTFEQINHAVRASQIFNENLPQLEKKRYAEDLMLLQEIAILAQFERLDKNQQLFQEYQKTQHYTTPNQEAIHITRYGLGHWISTKTGLISRIPENPELKEASTRKEFRSPELFMGDYQVKLGRLISSYLAKVRPLTESDSTQIKKISHKLYDDLIELSATCTDCNSYARRRHVASFMLGVYYFIEQGFSEANFYFSKALSELKEAGPEGSIHVTKLQAILLEKISNARSEEFEWVGNQFAMNAIYQPLENALQILEKAHYTDPKEGSTLSGLIRISNLLRKAHVKSFNFKTATTHCERTFDLYAQVIENQMIADASYGDFLECQIHLLTSSKQSGKNNEMMIYSRLIDIALRSNQIETPKELDWLRPNAKTTTPKE